MALDTRMIAGHAVWTEAENTLVLSEWEANLRPCGQARWGFIEHLTSLLPHRSPYAIKHQMTRLMRAGRMPRQRQRSTYIPIELRPAEAGYLAGMIDGEGSVRQLRKTKRRGGYQNGYVVQIVLCYNTDMAIIERVHHLVPAAKVMAQPLTPISTKRGYAVTLSGYQALRDVLCAVLPYMAHQEKRRRAEEILAFIEGRLCR